MQIGGQYLTFIARCSFIFLLNFNGETFRGFHHGGLNDLSGIKLVPSYLAACQLITTVGENSFYDILFIHPLSVFVFSIFVT